MSSRHDVSRADARDLVVSSVKGGSIMMRSISRWLLVLLVGFSATSVWAAPKKITWVGWSNDLFERAKKENKLVILDLEAIWCHWCHVMEEKTYSDPRVVDLLSSKYIMVKVDQDSRPDISLRYEDYGWPATIFFDSSGKELAKRSGYFSADDMLKLASRLAKNPKPEPSDEPEVANRVAASPFLTQDEKKELRKLHAAEYDRKQGGWGTVHKLLFGESEELALRDAWHGDKAEAARAKGALDAALILIDPVWGGAYQYSVDGWHEPHFEKIAETQAKNLRLYSEGYTLLHDPKYLAAAQAVYSYMQKFLADPEGAFYTSQDADLVQGVHSDGYFKLSDQERRKQGIPRIDKHIYARENGWYIVGLSELAQASSDPAPLKSAVGAADWIEAHRSLPRGGFRHGDSDPAGPYLGDTLAMGRAYLALYQATAERKWLSKAMQAAQYIADNFGAKIGGKAAGFKTAKSGIGPGLDAAPDHDENVSAARFFNLLYRYTADTHFKQMAEQAMRYVVSPDLVDEEPTAGVLLADMELSEAPVHVTVVGKKSDSSARSLFTEALKYPTSYKRVEWWDIEEGPLTDPSVNYPTLSRAAAFACSEGRCSQPCFDAKDLQARVDKLFK